MSQLLDRTADHEGRAGRERGLALAAIANAVVRVHKRFYGKGPTRARCHIGENLMLVVLEGGLLRSEQTLRDRGHEQAVVDARLALRRAIEPELRAAIESELHRSVRSLMGALDPAREIELLACVLDPVGTESLLADGPAANGDRPTPCQP